MQSRSRARTRKHFLSAVTEGEGGASHQSALSCVPSHLEKPQLIIVLPDVGAAVQSGSVFNSLNCDYPEEAASISAQLFLVINCKLALPQWSHHHTPLHSSQLFSM